MNQLDNNQKPWEWSPQLRALWFLHHEGIVPERGLKVKYLGFHSGEHVYNVDGKKYSVDLVINKWRELS